MNLKVSLHFRLSTVQLSKKVDFLQNIAFTYYTQSTLTHNRQEVEVTVMLIIGRFVIGDDKLFIFLPL